MTTLNPNYVHAKFKIRAVIGGLDFSDEIVAISASFPLNTIPTASITLAVGHDAKSGGRRQAKIHRAKILLRPRAPVTVWLTITPSGGKLDKMESGEIKIFEGFLVSIGYQRSHNSANYVINVVHWLDDLNNSSALNGKWFPNAPFLLAQNAAFEALQTSDGNVWSPVPIIDANEQIITESNISQNLWGDVIKPIFKTMAGWKTSSNDPNDAALKALERIPAEAPSVNGPAKLSLDISGVGLNAEMSIRQALTKDSTESFAYTTFWSTLVGDYATQFFFALSPCIDKSYVIPFFGGLKFSGSDKLTIHADDYSYANFNSTMHQLIENVTVFWPAQMDPMLHLGGDMQSSDKFSTPAGQWPPAESAQKPSQGLKLFKDLPAWLSNTSPWPIMCGPTTGEGGKRPGDCLAPQTGESTLPSGWKKPAELADAMSNEVCTRFAKHFYHTEFLSQRYGELSGKLRFDIAPGSIVKIKLPDVEVNEFGHMIAAVTKVSYAINAERALAGTSFDLSYIRTESEDNQTNKITQESAPLYNGQKWDGYTLK